MAVEILEMHWLNGSSKLAHGLLLAPVLLLKLYLVHRIKFRDLSSRKLELDLPEFRSAFYNLLLPWPAVSTARFGDLNVVSRVSGMAIIPPFHVIHQKYAEVASGSHRRASGRSGA